MVEYACSINVNRLHQSGRLRAGASGGRGRMRRKIVPLPAPLCRNRRTAEPDSGDGPRRDILHGDGMKLRDLDGRHVFFRLGEVIIHL